MPDTQEDHQDVSFFYLRDTDRHPIGVVAIRTDGTLAHLGYSLCSENDKWDRVAGVNKAVGRSRSKRSTVVTLKRLFNCPDDVLDQLFGNRAETVAEQRDLDWRLATAVLSKQAEHLMGRTK